MSTLGCWLCHVQTVFYKTCSRKCFENLTSKMLLSYLNSTPYSKFILIDDNAVETALKMLNFLITSRVKLFNYDIHYAIYEGCYAKKVVEDTITHDFTRILINSEEDEDSPTLQSVISKINSPSLLFIDSLVHLILKYGFKYTYQLLHQIMDNENILQVVAVYHTDILDDSKFLQYLQHLSTFWISLEYKFHSSRPRLVYVYKKSGGKIIKQFEEYYFEDGMLKTDVIKKLDIQKLLRESNVAVKPDELTTFKISLKDDEKLAKDAVILPYLPRDLSGEGAVFYEFDAVDDWDEEDPDDDLDI